MEKRYCMDTSAISNPIQSMPEDIHKTLWEECIPRLIKSGCLAMTTEIYDELVKLEGKVQKEIISKVGQIIKSNKNELVLEVNHDSWDWRKYIHNCNQMSEDYKEFISKGEFGPKKTVGENDITIICLAKTLEIPLISMEVAVADAAPKLNISPKKKRIPDICKLERIEHMTFSEFLRKENIEI